MQIINDTSAMIPEPCVATIGFFDGVHTGHRYLIQQVKEIAAAKGLRSALVTFPVHPRKVMNATYHPELLTTPEEKINLLAGTGVDYCLMLDFTPDISRLTAKEFMTQVLKERYQVRYLVIGYDHRFGHNRSEGFEDYVRYGQSIGIDVIRAQAYTNDIRIDASQSVPVSSSLIRKLLHQGDVDSCPLSGIRIFSGRNRSRRLSGRQKNRFPHCQFKRGRSGQTDSRRRSLRRMGYIRRKNLYGHAEYRCPPHYQQWSQPYHRSEYPSFPLRHL